MGTKGDVAILYGGHRNGHSENMTFMERIKVRYQATLTSEGMCILGKVSSKHFFEAGGYMLCSLPL